ncbi:MAG TPA: hypothetical protein VN908_11575 [Gemmatimonadales bacterium]|nr:hypothetical protein [Gemmatimonadales bacterium]
MDPVIDSGIVQASVTSPTPLAGALVEAFRTGNATALASMTTATDGKFKLTIATGGTPLDGYVRVSKASYIDTYAYPPAPLVANFSQSLLVLTSLEFNALHNAAGVTHTAGTGSIAVLVTDCTGAAVTGATVSTVPAGTVRYSSGGLPSSSATVTASDGAAYVFNVAAGDVTVRADSGSKTLRAHIVNARADAITITAIAPGPH